MILAVVLAGIGPAVISEGADALLGRGLLVQEAVHRYFEAVGSCIALGVALLLLLRTKHEKGSEHLIWVVAGLVTMGLLDASHALLPFGLAWSWLRHLATLAGGLFFGMIWLPLPAALVRKRRFFIIGLGVAAIGVALSALGVPQALPSPWTFEGYTTGAKATNVAGGLGFLAAAIFFFRRYLRQGEADELVFASQSLLFSTAGVLFGFSHVWGADWWAWHMFRFIAYSMVFIAAYQAVAMLYREIAGHASDLEREVQKRLAEQKRIEQQLREREERFRQIFEHAATGIAITDWDGRFIQCNPSYLGIVGYTEDELRQMVFADLVHAEDRDANLVEIRRLMAGEVPSFEIENRYRRKNGEHVWVLKFVSILRNDAGQPAFLLALVTDITERKQAEEAVRRSERLYRAIGESIEYGVWVCEPDGRNSYASESFLKLVGITQQQCSDFGWGDVLHPEDSERTIAAWKECVRTGGKWDMEHRFRGVDGRWHPILARGVPVRDETGSIVCWAGINLDISRLKEAQEDLRRAKDELAQTNANLERLVAERTAKLKELVAELEHFSYTITHDMRAPLRAIKGFVEVVDELCTECPHADQKEFLNRISISADRMDLLITDALNYSRAVRQELPLAPVGVGALLRGMLDSYPEFQLAKADIRLEGEIPPVMGNEAGLTQCFSNLLGNAVKFVKPGTRPEVLVRSELRDGWVRIWVEDNGIGIPPSMLHRVFDMFARGHHGYDGTGIGLALVRKVVHRMGGTVGVESLVGQGSRFWLDLRPVASG